MPEKDPNGLSAKDPGSKLDYGKNRLDLVLGEFARALWEVGRVGTYGASKYSDKGWIEVPNAIERYADAMYRHYLKTKIEGDIDPESGLLHYAHMAWNALAVLELTCRQLQSTPKQPERTSDGEQDRSLFPTATKKEMQDAFALWYLRRHGMSFQDKKTLQG